MSSTPNSIIKKSILLPQKTNIKTTAGTKIKTDVLDFLRLLLFEYCFVDNEVFLLNKTALRPNYWNRCVPVIERGEGMGYLQGCASGVPWNRGTVGHKSFS